MKKKYKYISIIQNFLPHIFLKISVSLILGSFFIFPINYFFSKPALASTPTSKEKDLIAQIVPPINISVVPTAVNGAIQDVVKVVPTVVNVTNNIVNRNPVSLPNNLPIPTLFQGSNQPGNTTGSTTSTTSNYYSTANGYTIPQTNNTGNPATNVPLSKISEKGVLILNKENTANGRIILTKDITEVIFGPDSLSHPGLLTFVMPPERGIVILFNFGAFLTNDINGSHVTLPQAIRMEQTSDGDNVSVTMPINENVAISAEDCGDDIWDGTITALMLLPQSEINLRDKNIGLPIEIGRSDCKVNLSRQAHVAFKNQANSQVGYRLQNQEKFTEITSLCPIKNNKECYTYTGKDLVVKTYHFTQFVTFKKGIFFDSFLSLIKSNNLIVLGLAILATFLLALLIGIFSISRKVKTISEVDKQKDEYVSIASHELRTPLTAVKGWISMILGGDYGSVKKSMEKPLHEVEASAQRSLNLVNDILDVSRIESGNIAITLSSFPIDPLVSEITTSLQPLAKEKGIILETNTLADSTVQADKDKVRQIITNLIANALKSTDAGKVSVSSEAKKDIVTIFVTDTGSGITKEDQQKLFHKFEQINTSSTKKLTGTGLGLYISRQLARKMGGDVYLVKSDMTIGSTFALSLLQADSKIAKKLARKFKK